MTDVHAATIIHAPTAALADDRAIHPLIAQVAAGRITPEQLSQMMALQERYEANEARKAYTSAMAALKAALPRVIHQDGKVDYTPQGKDRVFYRHATLAGVVDAVVEHLTAHGFSHSWVPARLPNGHVSVTCKLTHREGHSESCTLDAVVDSSGGKNGVQAVASTVTYLERYTILSLLGLATRDMKEPTGEETKQAPAGEGVDADRNLKAVAGLRRAGLELDAVAREIGRPAPEWTAADREKVRDLIQAKKPRAPRENADGSLSEDPPKE